MLAPFALMASILASGARAAEDVPHHDLIFLADDRPVFLRLRITVDGEPFGAAWRDSIGSIRAGLDGDGDGKLTAEEAGAGTIAALVRLAAGAGPASPRVDLGGAAEDGDISTEELAEAIRSDLGPFRVRFDRLAVGRTDALFDQLDRDKDGHLTEPELGTIAAALRGLDLNDDEMIGTEELEPYRGPMTVPVVEATERRARPTAPPSVVETSPDESSLRLARLLLRKYDTKRGDAPGPPDSKLSRAEFAVAPAAFDEADANGDDTLRLEELRRFVEQAPRDVMLDIALARGGSNRSTIGAGGDGALPGGVAVRQLDDGDVEIAVGGVRLDFHLDDGVGADEAARRTAKRRFAAADVNKDGYLDEKEFTGGNNVMAPFAGLFGVLDQDGDGKLVAAEMDGFLDRQAEAARGRLVLAVSDQGRAIFGIVDQDRDRRLGAREVMRTVERVSSWDADRDGRVAAEEVPYHFRVTLGRGGLAGLATDGIEAMARPMASSEPVRPDAGPKWFRRMDSNHDGDVSRREFLGTREQFDRLDGDGDGLIDAAEAAQAGA